MSRPVAAPDPPAAAWAAAPRARGGPPARPPRSGGRGRRPWPKARQPQVLSFSDPRTGTDVVLVAVMHFNPHSAARAAEVSADLLRGGRLGAVVVESCATRWERVQRDQAPGSLLHAVLGDEMQAAAEVAEAGGRPVVLGDQPSKQINARILACARTAWADLASPLQGGWGRTLQGIADGVASLARGAHRRGRAAEAAAEGPGSIGASDLLDPGLVVGTPVAALRYLAMSCLRSSRLSMVVLPAMALSLFPEAPVSSELPGVTWDGLASVLLVLLATFTLRVFVGIWEEVLIGTRNVVLARSIGAACAAVAGRGQAVVAVLGALHCNGVKELLLSGDYAGDAEPAPCEEGARSALVFARPSGAVQR